MTAPGFWDDQDTARGVMSEASDLKRITTKLREFQGKVEDMEVLLELYEESDEDQDTLAEVEQVTDQLAKEVDLLEIESFLSGKFDRNAAIMSINAGAGGTESCDWAGMLLRQYTRWAERNEFKVETQEYHPGEEAGISSVTIRIEGINAYGYAKAERGVHRLVRISPFDSNNRRHTSFCSVDVIAELEETDEVDLDEKDIRVDTYRASGKGGQHVNKTDSAVRLTHEPTGIIVTCQNERSQHKNKNSAMKTLKSRLFEREQDEKRAALEKFYGEKGEIGWGNQIRSYVFQPYQMVKDLRTGVETSNVDGVMDGEIDDFIHGWLRAGCPTQRNKDIQPDE
jgi:peptide chain release factor 2